jgi:hypothetical protein
MVHCTDRRRRDGDEKFNGGGDGAEFDSDNGGAGAPSRALAAVGSTAPQPRSPVAAIATCHRCARAR